MLWSKTKKNACFGTKLKNIIGNIKYKKWSYSRKGGFNGKGLILVILIMETVISPSCGYRVSLVNLCLLVSC